jgi:hypothetical protein
MRKERLLAVLEGLLGDVLAARFRGTDRARLARAHGYADGYMRALLDAGLVERAELLRLVGDTRAAFVDEGREGSGETAKPGSAATCAA